MYFILKKKYSIFNSALQITHYQHLLGWARLKIVVKIQITLSRYNITVRFEHKKMSHQSKDLKFNYLEQSFERELQRSYNRNQTFSPAHSANSRSVGSAERSPQRSSEFSPYQNKDPNIRQKLLVQELKAQNNVLNEQINHYKVMVENLHLELRSREEELNRVNSIFRSEQDKLEAKVRQMVEEINILLTKNTYLEERSVLLERELEKEKLDKRRSASISVVPSPAKPTLNLQLSHLLFPRKSQPSNLLNQSFQSKPPTASDEEIMDSISTILRKVNKHQQLVDSILQMYQKITSKRAESRELKFVWKWLKQLGHNYNIIHKWKKMLFELLRMEGSMDLITIDEVLQRTVVALHQR